MKDPKNMTMRKRKSIGTWGKGVKEARNGERDRGGEGGRERGEKDGRGRMRGRHRKEKEGEEFM
jgi:hypothetical protein